MQNNITNIQAMTHKFGLSMVRKNLEIDCTFLSHVVTKVKKQDGSFEPIQGFLCKIKNEMGGVDTVTIKSKKPFNELVFSDYQGLLEILNSKGYESGKRV